MTRALMLVLALVLSGCAVALSGHESTGSGGTARATTAATRGHVSIGSAKVGASFGTPAASGGGQFSFSRGASAVLVLGLVLAEVVNYLASPATGAHLAPDPARSIASTCSCYGYQPPSQLTYNGATE